MSVLRPTLAVLFIIISSLPLHAQNELLDSLVRANSYRIEVYPDSLGGPGKDFLMNAARDAQFFALGEAHNAEAIPRFTTALFHLLHERYGFNYLALEQDPLSCRLVSLKPIRGNRDSIIARAKRNPHSFTFISDQELEMIARVGGISTTEGSPIWGCDQAFGATHALERLIALAPSPEARSFATELLGDASGKEATRDTATFDYMAHEPKTEKLHRLQELFAPTKVAEARFIIDELVTSDRIYKNYREGNYYENGREREEYMKTRFMEEYRRAKGTGDSLPRVILKFGHWHIYRGLGPSSLPTLGNFAMELAKCNSMSCLQIALHPNGKAGMYGDISKWQKAEYILLLTRTISKDEFEIIDLRPLRPHFGAITRDLPCEVQSEFRHYVFGFDAALFFGGMEPATFEETGIKGY